MPWSRRSTPWRWRRERAGRAAGRLGAPRHPGRVGAVGGRDRRARGRARRHPRRRRPGAGGAGHARAAGRPGAAGRSWPPTRRSPTCSSTATARCGSTAGAASSGRRCGWRPTTCGRWPCGSPGSRAAGSTTPSRGSTGVLPGGVRLHAVLPPLADGGPHLSLRFARHRPGGVEALGAARGRHARPWRPCCARWSPPAPRSWSPAAPGPGRRRCSRRWWPSAPPTSGSWSSRTCASSTPTHPHVVRLQGRGPNVEGVGGVTLVDLVRQALRMRPDRLVVGEVRGAEVRELLAALNTGHEGGMSTLHANGPEEVPARFEALGALAGMPRDAVHAQLREALRVVVHVARRGGSRCVDRVGVVVPDPRIRGSCASSRRRGAARRGLVAGPGRDRLVRLVPSVAHRVPLGGRVLTAALVAVLACLLWPGRSRVTLPRRRRATRAGGDTGASWVRTAAAARARSAVPPAVRATTGSPTSPRSSRSGSTPGSTCPSAALASARSPGRPGPGARGWPPACGRRVEGGQRGHHRARGGARTLGPRGRGATWPCSSPRGGWPRRWVPPPPPSRRRRPTSVRERRAAADRTAVVVAGPRASMVLLSALPLAGPAAALLVGLPPGRLYDSVAARRCSRVVGLLLTAVGWWWARGLLRRARRPGRTDGDPRERSWLAAARGAGGRSPGRAAPSVVRRRPVEQPEPLPSGRPRSTRRPRRSAWWPPPCAAGSARSRRWRPSRPSTPAPRGASSPWWRPPTAGASHPTRRGLTSGRGGRRPRVAWHAAHAAGAAPAGLLTAAAAPDARRGVAAGRGGGAAGGRAAGAAPRGVLPARVSSPPRSPRSCSTCSAGWRR